MSGDQFVISFDPDQWTLDDVAVFEEYTGMTVEEAWEPEPVRENGEVKKDKRGRVVKRRRIKPRVAIALVYIHRHATDPSFTLADAAGVKLSDITFDAGGDEDPKDGGSETDEQKS